MNGPIVAAWFHSPVVFASVSSTQIPSTDFGSTRACGASRFGPVYSRTCLIATSFSFNFA